MNSRNSRVDPDTDTRRGFARRFTAAIAVVSALGLALGVPVGDAAPDARLGIYFDREGTICSGTVEPGVPTEIYIVAQTPVGGDLISGAEFRFVGLPASWVAYAVPNAGTLSIGDPFGVGVNIAATNESCQPSMAHFLMYTVLILATEPEDNVRFELRARNPPANPEFPCPLVTDCTSGYEKHCVQPSPCLINMARPTPCPNATTAVESASWTAMRNLYR